MGDKEHSQHNEKAISTLVLARSITLVQSYRSYTEQLIKPQQCNLIQVINTTLEAKLATPLNCHFSRLELVFQNFNN